MILASKMLCRFLGHKWKHHLCRGMYESCHRCGYRIPALGTDIKLVICQAYPFARLLAALCLTYSIVVYFVGKDNSYHSLLAAGQFLNVAVAGLYLYGNYKVGYEREGYLNPKVKMLKLLTKIPEPLGFVPSLYHRVVKVRFWQFVYINDEIEEPVTEFDIIAIMCENYVVSPSSGHSIPRKGIVITAPVLKVMYRNEFYIAVFLS